MVWRDMRKHAMAESVRESMKAFEFVVFQKGAVVTSLFHQQFSVGEMLVGTSQAKACSEQSS
jgi:hypothetical protein